MTRGFDDAVAHARARRRAFNASLDGVRGRLSPRQIAEDALSLIDPDLSLLNRLRDRVQDNRLLSLAVLAGVGWLAGSPRHHDGAPLKQRNAGTTPQRTHTKEKKNDSGQIHGEHWSGSGAGHQEEQRPQEPAQEAAGARRGRKTRQDRGSPPLERQPQQPEIERQL